MIDISPEEAKERLESPDNLVNLVVKQKHTGRPIGEGNIPPMMKSLIASLGRVSNQSAVAKAFDVSRVTVNNAANGKVGHREETVLQEVVKNSKSQVEDKALGIMLHAMNLIPEKINGDEKLKARDLASIAKDMSVIADNMTAKSDRTGPSVVIINSPKIRDESSYEVIEVEGLDEGSR